MLSWWSTVGSSVESTVPTGSWTRDLWCANPVRYPLAHSDFLPVESVPYLWSANPLCYPLNTFQQKIISYIYFTSSGFREPTLPDKMSIWAIIHYDSSWHEYWRTWARTVMRNPHMALSGVLCSRPLLISNDKVTVSPSTCHKEITYTYKNMKRSNDLEREYMLTSQTYMQYFFNWNIFYFLVIRSSSRPQPRTNARRSWSLMVLICECNHVEYNCAITNQWSSFQCLEVTSGWVTMPIHIAT